METEIKNIINDTDLKHIAIIMDGNRRWAKERNLPSALGQKEEVDFLMNLVAVTLTNELEEMHKENVQIHFIGDLTKLSDSLQKILVNAVETTKNNTGVVLQIALNYGSRDEIVNAVKKIVSSGINADDISEKIISDNLYTSNVPDPDILVRTGGEQRISNYLLWQIAYSEIIIRNEFWPEFDKNLLAECIKEFGKRQRRYGK